MAKGETHESHVSVTEVRLGSDRAFGCVFASVFTIIGLFPLIHGDGIRWWGPGVGAAFLALALVRPAVLNPLNRLWFRFGMVLHRVVSPLVMGLLFYTTVTPVGLLMRACGKDPMRLKRDVAGTSYWIARRPPGPAPESMKQQF